MTDTPASGPLRPPRYGRAPMPAATRRRLAVGLGVLAIVALLGVAVSVYQRFEGTDVEGTMVGYEVLDDQSVAVTISVTRKDPRRPAVCVVRARSKDGAETGRREILVEPAEARTVNVTATVKSYRKPFVGDIYGCGITVPPYLQRTG